jgi:hypothetical protein
MPAVGCSSRLCGRRTALTIAAAKGDTRTVEVLIAAGADVAAKDSDGWDRAPTSIAACLPSDAAADFAAGGLRS